jgi:dTDP-4-amino-4,6-dideoxygalactose transaminase
MGGAERKYVQEAFDTNWISPVGPHLAAFEKELASVTRVPHVAALTSGTAAIHLALILLGVDAGDEVICQSFTFSGTCNPIRYLGATPVFVDSEEHTWNMDPQLLEEVIEDRLRLTGRLPRAIIVVHLYGMPAQMSRIQAIAQRHAIPLIEDAAEALGAWYQGKPCGSVGDLGILSFNGNKIITTSGGGALLSANAAWIDKARFLATQAREPAPHYEHREIGYNYRLSNVSAGIGRGQLQVLEERVKQRRQNFLFYREALGDLEGFYFLDEPADVLSNRWLTTVVMRPETGAATREAVRLALEREQIESRPLWKPMHRQPAFQGFPAYSNGVSDRLFASGLCLPSGTQMGEGELRRVVDIIRKTVT